MARSLKIVKFKDDNLKYYIDKENLNHKEILDCIDTVCTNIINNNELLDYHVINLFGVGGKGKTLLTSKIKEKLLNNEFPIVYQNLYNPQSNRHNNKNNFLLNLRNKLVEKYNFSFPNFDIYITIAMNPDTINFSEYADKSYKKDNLDFFIKKSFKSISDEFTFGFTSVIFETLDKIKQNRKLLHDKNTLLYLNDIASQSPESFYNELQESFIFDYNSNVKDFKKPMIIIIDSFEEFPKNNIIWLYNYNNNSLQQIGNGLWHSLNKTVWIISGRDKLNLTIENEWSREYASFFELTNFSKNDTTKYLIKRNLSAEQSDIFFKNTSEGDPLLSFLLSNQLLENNNQIEILLSDTVKEKHRKDILISRYLRYIEGEDNKETNDRIKMLIALGSITKEEIHNFPQKIKDRLYKNSNTEDIDSFLKRSFITKYSEEYFSVHKCIKELFLSETYPDFHSRHGQQLIDDYIKCDAIEYLATKFSESKPMNKNDIIQIIRLVNTFKNIDSNEKWKKLTEEYGYFKDYLDFLNTNNKDLDLINFYLIMFYEFDLSSLSNETILVSLKKVIELYYFKYLVYYYNDISSLLLLLPESVQNTEYVATHFYNIGNFSKAKEIFLNLLYQNNLSVRGMQTFLNLSSLLGDNKSQEIIISKLNKINNNSLTYEEKTIKKICNFNSFVNNQFFSEASLLVKELKQEVKDLEILGLQQDFYCQLAIFYSKSGDYNSAIKTNLYCIDLIKNSENYYCNKLILADIYNNLAGNYFNTNNITLFNKFLKESMIIREKYLPHDSYQILEVKNNYALSLLLLGDIEKALSLFLKVLPQNKTIFGDNHIKISKNQYNIGLCYYKLEKYEKALSYFISSYNIKINFYHKKETTDTLKTYTKILLCSSHFLSIDNYKDFLNKIEYILNQQTAAIKLNILEINECIETLSEFLLYVYKEKITSVEREKNQLIAGAIAVNSFIHTLNILLGSVHCSMNDIEEFKYEIMRDTYKKFSDDTLNYKQRILYYFYQGKNCALLYILNNELFSSRFDKNEYNYYLNILENPSNRLIYLKILIKSLEKYYGKIN